MLVFKFQRQTLLPLVYDHSVMSRSLASKLILKNTCLPLLGTCKSMEELKQIHAQILRTGLSEDYFASTKMLETFSLTSSPDLDYARLIFYQIETPNTFTWNTLIKACSKARNSNNVLALYKEMLRKGNRPNGITFSFVSKACADVKNLQILLGIEAQVFKLGFYIDVFVLNSLIHAFSVCGSVDFARKVFDELPTRDLISWTVVINNYVWSNRAKEAIDLFFLMVEEKVRPDEVVAVAIFTACARLGDLCLAKRIENLIGEMGIERNAYVMNSLIDMYAKCGSIGESWRLFDKMSDKNVVSWNSMIAACARSGNMEAAKRLFSQMPEKNNVSWSALLNGYLQNGAFKKVIMVFHEMGAEGVLPTDAAITGAIAACAHVGALELGKEIHASLDERKVWSDVVLSSALVNMYAKCGCLEDSCYLFDRMEKKNRVSCNVMIMGLAIHGKASGCISVFSEMLKEGIEPDSITFTGMLTGCAHAGWLVEGKHYFDQMTAVYGIQPRAEHCSSMVHLLGRAGLIDQAYGFIRASPVNPDVVMWGALLNACKLHGNVELGELAARHILELDPSHGGAHVLLSSIYAAAKKWTEVMEIRKSMRVSGVKNRPGWSWIELDGAIHEFLVGDNLHPEIKEILYILGAIESQICLTGKT